MRHPAALAVLVLLTGCYSGPREYHYDLELKNACDRPVALELLQARSSTIAKTRADLAPGGIYSNAFTTYSDAEYLEARLRFMDTGESDPWFIAEPPQGRVRAEITAVDGKLALNKHRPTPPDSPP